MNLFTLNRKVAVFLVLVPLLLVLYPALQWHRVNVIERDQVSMTQTLEALRENSKAKIRLPSFYSMKAWSRETLAQQLREDLDEIEQQGASLTLRWLLAVIGVFSALGAAGLGVWILCKVRFDSLRGRYSFDYLLSHFSTSWQQVSRAVQWHVAAMLGALVAMVCYEAVWSYANWYSHGPVAVVMTLPLWGTMLGAFYLLRRLRQTLQPIDPLTLEIIGREQNRSTTPGLWQWIEQIAAKARTPLPDHIVVGLEACFFVTGCEVRLLPQNVALQGRTLYLPLTYLSLLDQAETAAIIAHELGHFAHGDTDNSAQLAPLYRAMEQRIGLMQDQQAQVPSLFNHPAIWTSVYFLSQFDRAFQHWSRQQELAADQVSVRAESAFTVASALLRVSVLSERFDEFFARRREDGNLVRQLIDFVRQQPLRLTPETLHSPIAHPSDSHPPTRTRVESLAVALDETLLSHALREAGDAELGWFSATLVRPVDPSL